MKCKMKILLTPSTVNSVANLINITTMMMMVEPPFTLFRLFAWVHNKTNKKLIIIRQL